MKKNDASVWVYLAIIAIGGFAADWYTKSLVLAHISPYNPLHIIGEYVQIVLVFNKAALFGLDPRHILPWFPLNAVFSIVAFGIIGFLVYYYSTIDKKDLFMRTGIGLIMAGALGNVYDRMFFTHRGVVDFIRVGISPQVYWPIFNLADIFVTLGVGILLICFVRDEKKNSAAKASLPVSQK